MNKNIDQVRCQHKKLGNNFNHQEFCSRCQIKYGMPIANARRVEINGIGYCSDCAEIINYINSPEYCKISNILH